MTEIAKKPSKKTRIGVVSSNKMEKSITVLVERRLRHPIYGKYVKKSKKFMAHDEKNDCNIGDTVKIMESRPLSAKKRWRLVEVIQRAK
ncbi:MAG: 30S ribosomal protein S17 [Saprospiraceae bacterium]